MPRIGNVDVPDVLIRAEAPESARTRARPTYGEIIGAGTRQAIGQVRYGLPYALDRATSYEIDPVTEGEYQSGLRRAAQAGSEAVPASVSDLTSGRVNPLRFALENLAASVPQTGAILAGGLGGGLVGGPGGALAGAVAVGSPLFAGSNVARAVEEEGSLSNAAAERALAVAPLQAGAEALVGRFLPGAGRVLGRGAAVQSASREGFKGFLERTGKSVIKAGGTEAITEVGQQVGERYAAGLPVGGPEAAREYVDAAVTAFAVGGLLGSAGGFRRSSAIQKNAADVTPSDLDEYVQRITEPGRMLPAPPDYTVDGGGTARVNPSGTQQLSLPSPERFAGPDVYVDAVGRATSAGPEGVDPTVLANLPRTSDELDLATGGRNLDEMLGQGGPPRLSAPPDVVVDPQGGAVARGPDGAPIPTVRPLADAEITDLTRTAKGAKDPYEADAARSEIARRVAEVMGDADLTADNYQTRVDDLKQGLRGGFVQSLEAAGPQELLGKVYDQVVTDQDTRKNTLRFAQRVGILDAKDEFKLGPKGQEIAAAREAEAEVGVEADTAPPVEVEVKRRAITAPEKPAAPSAPTAEPSQEFLTSLKERLPARRDPTVKALSPVDEADLQRQVLTALGQSGEIDYGKQKVTLPSPQMEQVAQKIGLIDENKDMTPLGRKTYLQTQNGFEDTVEASRSQGYDGKLASVFERGVRDYTSDAQTETFPDFGEMAAYTAGRTWAAGYVENRGPARVRTAEETRTLTENLGGETVGTRDAERVRQLTPEQTRQGALHNLMESADLRTVPDDTVASLHRMIRDGATVEEFGRALQDAQGGGLRFEQPPRRPAATTSARPDGRGQPRFREIDPRQAGTEGAVEVYRLRSLVEFARNEGAVDAARASRLHDLLDAGKVTQVARSLKSFDPDAKPARRLPKPGETEFASTTDKLLGAGDIQFEQAVAGKSFQEVLDHMIVDAPSKYAREVARMVKGLAGKLEKLGTEFTFTVVRPGDIVPARLNRSGSKALAHVTRNPSKAAVYLKSMEFGEDAGVNYQVALHEMLHAVTMSALKYGNLKDVSGQGQIGAAVSDLYALSNEIIDHFNTRAAEGKLNDFEKEYLERRSNQLSNPDEILAWGLSNPQMQRYLASIEYKPRQSVFGRLVELLRKLLGLDGKYDTALTELLRVSEQILKAPQRELESMVARLSADGMDTAPAQADARSETNVSAANRTVSAANEATQRLMSEAGKFADDLKPGTEFFTRWRDRLLPWMTRNQKLRWYGSVFPGLQEHADAEDSYVAVRNRLEQKGIEAYNRFDTLPEKTQGWARELMALSTTFQVDPDKAFKDQKHLLAKRDDTGVSTPEELQKEQRNQAVYKKVSELRDKLSRGDGTGKSVFDELRMLNEAQNYARMASALHRHIATDKELSLGVPESDVNPIDKFMEKELGSAENWRDELRSLLDQQLAFARQFAKRRKTEAVNSDDLTTITEHLAPVEALVEGIYSSLGAMSRAPYFHLARFGEYYGSGTIRKNADGTVDRKALGKFAAAMDDAGFGYAQMDADNTSARFRLQFETSDQMQQFEQVMKDLRAQGMLDPDTKFESGLRQRGNGYGVSSDSLPEYVQRYIQSVEAHPMYIPAESATQAEKDALREQRDQAVRAAIDTWTGMLPDNSIRKVLVQRTNAQGADKDMMRGWLHRWRVGAINIAHTASAPKFYNALARMESDVSAARQEASAGEDRADPVLLQQLLNDTRSRDARGPIDDMGDSWDKMRAFAHSYFLGLSPAYNLINLTQQAVLGLPELAKRNGYSKSFHAMRRASPKALAVMRAVASQAAELGGKHRADVVLTREVFEAAKLSESERKFLRKLVNENVLEFGSAAREFGRIADSGGSSRTQTMLNYASIAGLYTETFNRVTMALAAHDLSGGGDSDTVVRYAKSVVRESMLDYDSNNTATRLGKQGFAGPATPMLIQFQSYSIQVLEKLIVEISDALGRPRLGETAEQTKQRAVEARRFLVGHMTAITALAGTLGLPFASVLAGVVEKLVDAFDDDDEPFDATAAWRNFLADVFGKDAAEVISRGVPRAIGFDVSQRAGEQDLIPFTDLLTDRRGWRDAVESAAGNSIGAVPGMALDIAEGGAKIADGDLLGGLETALPLAFRSGAKAFRMTSDGYVDSKGNKLPMTPAASAYLFQLIGFSPAEKAEYSEARGAQAARRGDLTREAGQLRQRIIRNLLSGGDPDERRDLIAEAIKFDQDTQNAFGVIEGLQGSLTRGIQSRARAEALQAPIGVPAKDIAAQSLTRYANVGYTAQ